MSDIAANAGMTINVPTNAQAQATVLGRGTTNATLRAGLSAAWTMVRNALPIVIPGVIIRVIRGGITVPGHLIQLATLLDGLHAVIGE